MKVFGSLAACAVLLAGCTAVRLEKSPLLPMLELPPGANEVYLTGGMRGAPVIDRGCVRIASASAGSVRTVLWHRGTELGQDREGYFLRNGATGRVFRFGREFEFGGGEMPREWAEHGYPQAVRQCGGPYASGWLPE